MTEEAAALIGDNNPPLKEQLEIKHEEIFARIDELMNDAKNAPAEVTDDKTCGDVQDMVRMMRKALKAADDARQAEKLPFDDAVKVVNATFKKPSEALETVMKDLKERAEKFLELKKEKERQRLAEIAAKEREERDRKAKEAAEAEQRRKDAEAAEAKAKAEAAAAEKRRDDARKEAEAAEKRARDAKEAAEREEARQAAITAKAVADRATIAKVEADAAAREAKTEQREANRDAVILTGEAVRAEKRAERVEEAAKDDAAMSRTRGDLGTVGSLAKRWTCRVVDYDALPLKTLLPFIGRDAIDSALYRLMQTGVRELPGAIFEQVEEARIA
jgi:chromosome segregation ATPase